MKTLTPPAWVMRLVFLIFFPITLGSIYLIWKYQIDGINSLVISDEEKGIRRFGAGVLMAAHVGFVFAVAILVGRQFIGWKRAMWILAAAIWVFDGTGMYFFRFNMMDKANSTMVTQVQRVEDRRDTIKGIQATAKGLRDAAPRLLANTRIKEANDNMKRAAKLEDDAAALEKELQAMPTGAGTSEVKAWGGESGARWRAIAEAALVSFVLVVCASMTGISLSSLYGHLQPVPTPPEIKPVAGTVNLEKVAPGWSLNGLVPANKAYGILPAGLAASAASAAPAPPMPPPDAQITISAPAEQRKTQPAPTIDAPAAPDAPVIGASEQTHQQPDGASKQTHQKPPSASKQTHQKPPSASNQTHSKAAKTDAPKAKRAAHRSTAVAGGRKLDTGTGPNDGHRYRRIRDAVEARTLAPGLRAIQAKEGGGAPIVRGYLAAMHAEGLIEPGEGGKGWVLVAKAPKA